MAAIWPPFLIKTQSFKMMIIPYKQEANPAFMQGLYNTFYMPLALPQ